MLRGIDINPFKEDLDLGAIQFDFMLDKATGGNAYVNPDCDPKVQRAMQLGKKWGVFHYFGDGYNDNDPIAEANFFVDNILGYVGKGILALDWERGGNPNVNRVDMALAWLQHVEGRTGVKPLIYMSMSLYQALDWSSVIAAGYALWVASWPGNNNIVANYGIDPNLDPNPKWDGTVGDILWQFTSTGRLDGYGGNLDCDLFYGTAETWDAYARSVNQPAPAPAPAPQPEPTTTTTTTVAAETPQPDPVETTTTTTTGYDSPDSPAPEGTTTTTTTAQAPGGNQPASGPGWWASVIALLRAILKHLQGVK